MFRAVTIDDKIQIGYGVAVADVDGDGRPDILLADKRQIVWYRNPSPPSAPAAREKGGVTTIPWNRPERWEGPPKLGASLWEKFVIAENLTEKDNVCLAAQDLDGDGKCELAVGAEWNPGDTVNSGAVFYLIPPADRTQRWEPVKFPSVEPTTHRMKWIKLEDGKWGLVVVPLHGRGNKNGEGAPVKVLLYHPPTPLNDAKGEWKSEVIDESMHMTHNFDPLSYDSVYFTSIMLAGREGIAQLRAAAKGPWDREVTIPASGPGGATLGAGEIRLGLLGKHESFIAAVEPMHGNQLVVYTQPTSKVKGDLWVRHVLTEKLTEGHALACGDLFGAGSEQIVVGWRGKPGQAGSTTGVAVWTPLDSKGEKWRETVIDPDGMACEDLVLADLNGDGKLDIVASGRATKNVKIYFNDRP
jgi:hypothetical protein